MNRLILVSLLSSLLAQNSYSQESSADLVGRWRDDYIVTPVNQVLTPLGLQTELSGMRPQVIALSPDGKLLITAGKTSEIVVVDPETGEVKQRVLMPEEDRKTPPVDIASTNILKPDRSAIVSYTGLVFAPNGRKIFMSNVGGSIKVFNVSDNNVVTPSHSIALPPANAPRRKPEIPSGLSCSPDGKKLYVCGNLSNQLLEVDIEEGQVTRSFPVGMAPYDVVIEGDWAIVSNWAGRRPTKDDTVGPAGRGTVVRVDPVRFIASEGSVSFVNLQEGNQTIKELVTGLHASALAISPDKKFVVCANAGSDFLSIFDLSKQEWVENVWTKMHVTDLFGASPNALAFTEDGKELLVANGTHNAIAVFDWDPEEKGDTKLKGMIPVGWFPGAIAYDASRKNLYVANIKGLPIQPKRQSNGTEGFNSHHYHGSLSIVNFEKATENLPALSAQVAKNLRYQSIRDAALPPRKEIAAKPVPERIGEPSVFKHVVYILKENRTYDQVLGDLKQGRGRADLCIFGESVTPNNHKLANEFVLLDNTYCAGILSADGHNWSTTSFSTDYLEKSFAGFPRSYPDGMGLDEVDAIAYSPAGFIWDNVTLHKKSIRNYGEFMMPQVRWKDPTKKGAPNYLACYNAWKNKTDDVIFGCSPSIESLTQHSNTSYVGWNMSVPDQYRADIFIDELKEYEAKGDYPNFVIICLPNDHTSGTSPNCPTPRSCMADSDLAFGRIVEAISHSKFWKDTVIFAIEDDPQAGWDHISGYRTTAFCISPYTKRNTTISTQYNTTCILRTIEQILGLPPMNQFDASATPMFDCFQEAPDFTPYVSVPNNIPLDEMNPAPNAYNDPVLKNDAVVSATLNFNEIDKAPEDVLNQILWRSQKGSSIPYPQWAITVTDEEEEELEEAMERGLRAIDAQ